MMRRCRLAARVAMFLLAVLCARTATAVASDRPPWLHVQESLVSTDLVPAEALTLAKDRETALTQDGYGFVELLSRFDVHLGTDGVVRERITAVKRFLSSAGVQSGGNLIMLVSPAHEDASILAAYVRTSDGRLVGADPGTIQVTNYPQPSVFSDVSTVTVPFRELAPGATVVLVFETRFRSQEWPLPWSAIFPLQKLVPMEQLEATVNWDDGVAAPAWQSDDPALKCREEGSRRVRCSRQHIDAFALDPQLASYVDLIPQFIVRRERTWPELAGDVARMIDGQIGAAPEVTALAHKLAAQPTRQDALAAIYRFVADEVRYVALEHGNAAVVPHPPQLTLERRFGDCKDKVTLFVALARAAGFNAHAVLTAADRYRLSKLIAPTVAYFNHMIACVDDADHEPICMDLTMPSAVLGELPPTIEGAVALDLTAHTDAPRNLPQSRYAWDLEAVSANQVRCDGSIEEKLERRIAGPGAMLMRKGMNDIVAQDRVRWAEEEFHRVVRRDVKPSISFTGLYDAGKPFIIASDTDFPGARPLAQQTALADWDPWLIDAMRKIRSTNRHHPYRHEGLRLRSHVAYRLCGDVEAFAPGAELDLRSPYGALTRTYRLTPSEVQIDTTLDVPRIEVSGQELERYNLFLTRAADQSRIWFGLRGAHR